MRALLVGMLIGGALSGFELVLICSRGTATAALVLGLPALLVAAGALLGLWLGGFDELGRRWEARGLRVGRALALTLAVCPWWVPVGPSLGASRALLRLAPRLAGWPASLAGAVVLGALVLGAALAGLRLGRRMARDGRPPLRFVLAAAAAGLAAAFFVADAGLWHGLYPALHAGLLGMNVAALLGATTALGAGRRLGSRRPGLALGGLAALTALLGVGAALLLRSSENIWFLAHERTVAARQVLALVMRARMLRPVPPPPAPPPGPRRKPQRRTPIVAESQAVKPPSPKSPGPKSPGPKSPGPRAGRSVRQAAAHPPAPLPAAPDAHLVLITIDALRADHLGAYGYARPDAGPSLSPHIDELAARGVRFERAYAQAPHTAYSIASLLTSEYIHSMVRLGLSLPPTLADLLEARGWSTEAYFPGGLFFNGRRELGVYAEHEFGFGRTVTTDLDARMLTDRAIARLEELERAGEPRTFLWLHYFDTHEPYDTHPGFAFGPTPLDRYDSEIGFLDRELGRLIAALERLHRPVVLALTADHGEEFKEHGGWYHGSTLYDEQVRVPLIVVAPGVRPRVVREPVELVDLGPTLLGLVGEVAPESLRGDDLAPALVGQGEPRRAVYSEMDGRRMVVARGMKLIHDVRQNTWELYDLGADPRELDNRYDRAPEQAAALERELAAWIDGLSVEQSLQEPASLRRARLGDRETIPELAALLADGRQPEQVRIEAARLAGTVNGYGARGALRSGLISPSPRLRAEAALALGELQDRRALLTLVDLLDVPEYRHRAAVMLGRLRDRRAMPALLEVINSPDGELRRSAMLYIGFVGDERAVGPLIASGGDLRTRYLIGLALGRIGGATHDARVLPALLDLLGRETYEDNRAYLACALGFLGDPRGLPAARRAALAQPPVKWASETLIRLGALERGVASGVDFAPGQDGLGEGFIDCHRLPTPKTGESEDDYARRTTCKLAAPRATVGFSVAAARDAVVLLRLRPEAVATGAQLVLRVNGQALDPITLDPGWVEHRLPVPARLWRAGANEVELERRGDGRGAGAWLELDHLLVLPLDAG